MWRAILLLCLMAAACQSPTPPTEAPSKAPEPIPTPAPIAPTVSPVKWSSESLSEEGMSPGFRSIKGTLDVAQAPIEVLVQGFAGPKATQVREGLCKALASQGGDSRCAEAKPDSPAYLLVGLSADGQEVSLSGRLALEVHGQPAPIGPGLELRARYALVGVPGPAGEGIGWHQAVGADMLQDWLQRYRKALGARNKKVSGWVDKAISGPQNVAESLPAPAVTPEDGDGRDFSMVHGTIVGCTSEGIASFSEGGVKTQKIGLPWACARVAEGPGGVVHVVTRPAGLYITKPMSEW